MADVRADLSEQIELCLSTGHVQDLIHLFPPVPEGVEQHPKPRASPSAECASSTISAAAAPVVTPPAVPPPPSIPPPVAQADVQGDSVDNNNNNSNSNSTAAAQEEGESGALTGDVDVSRSRDSVALDGLATRVDVDDWDDDDDDDDEGDGDSSGKGGVAEYDRFGQPVMAPGSGAGDDGARRASSSAASRGSGAMGTPPSAGVEQLRLSTPPQGGAGSSSARSSLSASAGGSGAVCVEDLPDPTTPVRAVTNRLMPMTPGSPSPLFSREVREVCANVFSEGGDSFFTPTDFPFDEDMMDVFLQATAGRHLTPPAELVLRRFLLCSDRACLGSYSLKAFSFLNHAQPHVSVSKHVFDFGMRGRMQPGVSLSDTFIITNATRREVAWKCRQGVPLNPAVEVAFKPSHGKLKKGANVTVSVTVTFRGKEDMGELGVVEVETGLNQFLAFRVQGAGAVFGVAPSTLEHVTNSDGMRVPKALQRMRDYLFERRGHMQQGIFRLAPDDSVTTIIKDQINSGTFVEARDVNVIANLLKVWFRDLPVKLLSKVPREKLDMCDDRDCCRQGVEAMPEQEGTLLRWLISMLASVAEHQGVNMMTSKNLAVVVAPNLFDTMEGADPYQSLLASQKAVNFVHNLILLELEARGCEGLK